MSTVIQSVERGAPLAERRPLITVVLPAFNEAAILERNLADIYQYLRSLDALYRWEVILVNDGSSDATGAVADGLRASYPELQVIHHVTNFGLGQAFKSAFGRSRGDIIVTLDVDLSYAPEHIGQLLDKMIATRAKLVLASPYMKGGRLTNVPPLRRRLSIWGNRFLRIFAGGDISTLTCMVRAYDGPFLRSLVLRSVGMDIMPEVIYKTMILRGRIEQIPAHLDWSRQVAAGVRRTSSMRILKHVLSTVLSGFIFRPFLFLVVPGFLLLAFSIYVNAWMLVHFFNALFSLPPDMVGDRASAAVAQAYALHPHTFIVGLLSLMLAIQLIGLGTLALQAKKYFEELFYVGVTLRRTTTFPEPANGERDRWPN